MVAELRQAGFQFDHEIQTPHTGFSLGWAEVDDDFEDVVFELDDPDMELPVAEVARPTTDLVIRFQDADALGQAWEQIAGSTVYGEPFLNMRAYVDDDAEAPSGAAKLWDYQFEDAAGVRGSTLRQGPEVGSASVPVWVTSAVADHVARGERPSANRLESGTYNIPEQGLAVAVDEPVGDGREVEVSRRQGGVTVTLPEGDVDPWFAADIERALQQFGFSGRVAWRQS